MEKKTREEIDLSHYGPIEEIKKLILLEQERKRKEAEKLLTYASDKALEKEFKKRNLNPQISLF